MLTRGTSAAGLLLVFLYLVPRPTITNAELIRPKRATASYPRQSIIQGAIPTNDNINAQIYEFLDIHDPRKINNDILALAENQNVVPSKDDDEPSLDQQVGQSEIITVNTDDTKGLKNIEHASSVIEYEPQKINRKGKRKIVDTFNHDPDSSVSSNKNSNLASPEAASIYYEVPRNVQPKIAVTPQYYARASSEPSKPSEIEAKPRSRDVGHAYTVPTPKPLKSRPSRIRPSFNPRTTPQTDATNFENAPPYKSYTVLSTEPTLRKQKYYTDAILTTAPPTDVSYTTRASRRKKNRKRIVNGSLAEQELPEAQANSNNNNNNYLSEFNKPRSATSSESRNKSRRLGLLAKYDVAPRPFTSGASSKGSREGNFEKSIDEGVVAGVTRGSNNRNDYSNAIKAYEGEPNIYSKVVDPVRASLSGLNRKLYERKDNRESSTTQVNVNSNPLPMESPNEPYGPQSFYLGEDNTSLAEENYQVPEENDYSQERNLDGKSTSDEASSVTPSSLDEYRNIKLPVITDRSENPVISTVPPRTVPYLSPNNYAYYPPVLSTLAPVGNFDVKGARGLRRAESKSRVARKKKRKGEVVTGDRKIHRGVSDGVAQATNAETDNSEESKGNGEYEIHETPNEGYKGEYSEQRGQGLVSHNQDDERVTKNDGDGSDGSNGEEDKGNGGYAETHDDRKETDAHSDGSHDNESHQSLMEGAADDDAMEKGHGGGQGKFEKGEGAEQEEEHHEAEGEKGDKGYKSWHEDEKANKGHHDKERRNNYYDEKDGKEKEHEEESGYHQEHLEDEKGGKQTEFSEKGEHQKGYNTKGQHFVHKKDEFEKRTEFFDEYHEDGDTEKDGEFYHEHEMSKGDNYKVGHHDEDDHEEKYGKEGKYEKGSHYKDNKGHKINEGDDSHYENEDVHGKKGEHRDEKKWSHKKGDDGDGGEKN